MMKVPASTAVMLPYKGVIFDFNGTLFFDGEKHLKAWQKMAKQIAGYDLSEASLNEHFHGVPNRVIIERLVGHAVDDETLENLSGQKEALYREACLADPDHLHLVPGAQAYFDFLKENKVPMTICTASIKVNVDFFFEVFKLERWFCRDKVVYDDGTYVNKTAMYKQACRILQLQPSEVRVYEDAPSGIQNALDAGIGQVAIISNEACGLCSQRIVGTYSDFQSCV